MDTPTTNLPDFRERYVNTIGTIKMLLKNVDADLMELNNTCMVINPLNTRKQLHVKKCKSNVNINNSNNHNNYYCNNNNNTEDSNKNVTIINQNIASTTNTASTNTADIANNTITTINTSSGNTANTINKDTTNKKTSNTNTNTIYIGACTTNTTSTHINKLHRNKRNDYINSCDRSHKEVIRPTNWLVMDDDSISTVKPRSLSNKYRSVVIDAYKNRRIFTIHGNYRTLRRALLCRGWIEKLAPGRLQNLLLLSDEALLQHARSGNDYEAVAISRIINHFPAFFIWQPKSFGDMNIDVLPHRNRVRRSRNFDFTTKPGLIGCAEHEHWYRFDGLGMKYPRFYRISIYSDERDAFIVDYRHTQCRSLLRLIVENSFQLDVLANPQEGTVDLNVLNFALIELERQVTECDSSSFYSTCLSEDDQLEWQRFCTNSGLILLGRYKFKATPIEVSEYVERAQDVLESLDEMNTDYKMDGCRNLWILKPGYRACGIGILVKSCLDDILRFTMSNSESKYIVQKYIDQNDTRTKETEPSKKTEEKRN